MVVFRFVLIFTILESNSNFFIAISIYFISGCTNDNICVIIHSFFSYGTIIIKGEIRTVVDCAIGECKTIASKSISIGLRNTIIGPVHIGNHVNLAQNVTVTGLNHNYQDAEKMIDEQGVSTLPVIIEDDVWVGANSVILPGVTLGKHCVVAAGSVVSHSVPPYSICAGCPARIIKAYDFETKEWKKVEKTPATNYK